MTFLHLMGPRPSTFPLRISDAFPFVAMSMLARRSLSMNTMSSGKMPITCHGILLNMSISRFAVLL